MGRKEKKKKEDKGCLQEMKVRVISALLFPSSSFPVLELEGTDRVLF